MNKKRFGNILLFAALSCGAFTMILPLLWMIATSFKESAQIFEYPPKWVPSPFYFKNYLELWEVMPFARFFLNSLFVSACVTMGQVTTSSLAAYSFARLSFPGRDRIFFGYLSTMMIPGAVTMIPVFILMKFLGWADSYYALIIPGMFSAYGTFMLRQFFMSIPKDLEDAAKIDGCGYFQIFWHVALPTSKSALASLTVFTFMGNWNSFMWPLIIIDTMEKKTLPIGLASFQGMYSTNWSLLMAGSVVVLLPVLILFVLTQRFFKDGFKLSGFGGI